LNAREFAGRELELLAFIRKSQQITDGGVRPIDAARSLYWTHGTVARCLRSLFKAEQLEKKRRGTTTDYCSVVVPL
jgi:hypothetical protein